MGSSIKYVRRIFCVRRQTQTDWQVFGFSLVLYRQRFPILLTGFYSRVLLSNSIYLNYLLTKNRVYFLFNICSILGVSFFRRFYIGAPVFCVVCIVVRIQRIEKANSTHTFTYLFARKCLIYRLKYCFRILKQQQTMIFLPQQLNFEQLILGYNELMQLHERTDTTNAVP